MLADVDGGNVGALGADNFKGQSAYTRLFFWLRIFRFWNKVPGIDVDITFNTRLTDKSSGPADLAA